MNDIINAAIVIITMISGGVALKTVHSVVQRAALEKASQGLPSLTSMTHSIQKQREKPRDVKR